jgi:murein L,D-transpeptidase YafK
MKRCILAAVFDLLMAVRQLEATPPVPSSPRSREVENRVSPRLKRDLASRNLRLGCPILMRIFKEGGEAELWVKGGLEYVLFRTHEVCYLSGTLGPKTRQGDFQSSEGFCSVSAFQMNPSSGFHLSFDIGYPNSYDRVNGRTGSALMVHAGCVSIGCYAMTDES